MDIGSIFLILGILVLVVLYVSQPFVQRKATVVSHEEHAFSALLAERDRIVNALQELDFDFTLGKIPEDSYASQRIDMLQRGAGILRQIDNFQGELVDDTVGARLEAAIQSRRAESQPTEASLDPDDELEALIANRRRARNGKSGGFCSQCGNAIQKSDRFCPRCGHALT
jgi:hypothetical protein